jgi:dihydroorotase
MSTILIKNAKVVNEGSQKLKDVFIVGEYIQQIGTDLNIEADQIIDATGKHLLPGLIDDQVHFREPGLTHKATIGSESRAAVAGGITSFIEMPNTKPQATNIIELEKKFDRASETSLANYSFMFGGTNDNIEEIRKLDKSKVAGLKLFLGSSTGNMLVDDQAVLREIFLNTDLLISVHCEDEATVRANFATYKERYGEDIPIEAHPEIRSHEACYLSSSRAIALAKETGARLHVFHLSTAQETDLFRNDIPLNEKKITAEVCVHHLWFSSEDYKTKGTLIKWNPAVKNQVDQDALWKALNDDRIDVLATDHAPHTQEEKNNKYASAPSGAPLVQHALLALLTAVGKGKISIEKLVQKACHNPAILFEIEKRGYVKEGFYADLVLVDLNKKTLVTEESLLYQCKWSPFEGETFEAKIDTTWVNGSCVYDKGIVIEKKAGKRLTFNR